MRFHFVQFIKKYLFQITTSVIFPFLFFSPYLKVFGKGSDRFHYFFLDELNLYLPQFINSYFLFKNMIFSGTDFLTANGSSLFFLRPNIVAAYPVYYLSFCVSYILKITSIETLALVLLIIMFAHMILGMFFSQLLALRFFKFEKLLALLFAVFVIFSSKTIFAKPFPPFFYIVMLMPLLIYTAMLSLESKNKKSLIIFSFVYLLAFLSGYIPMAVGGVIIAILFAVFYHVYINNDGYWRKALKGIIQLIIPVAIASIVAVPFYLAVMSYHGLASTVSANLRTIARDLAFSPSDILTMISYGIKNIKTNGVGTLYVGLIPLSLIFAFVISSKKNMKLSSLNKRLIIIGLLIFIFSFLISFGLNIGLADIFYTLVPGLGGMHEYGRYMMLTNIFFFLFITIILDILVKKRALNFAKIALILSFLLLVFMWIYQYMIHMKIWSPLTYLINMRLIIGELILFMFFLVMYIKASRRYVMFSIIGAVFIINTTYAFFIMDSNRVYYQSKDNIILHQEKVHGLIDFIDKNTDKALPKYVNTSKEVYSFVPRNFPWLVQNKFRVSNYYGYELHLASYLGYRERMPYYGNINFNWLLKTGCDFIIVDETTDRKYEKLINKYIDKDVYYQLQDSTKIYKTKKINLKDGFSKGSYFLRFTTSADKDGIIFITIDSKSYEVEIKKLGNVVGIPFEIKDDVESMELEVDRNNLENLMIKNIFLGEYEHKWIPIKKIDFDNRFSNFESLKNGWRRFLIGQKGIVNIFRTSDIGIVKTQVGFDNGIIKIEKCPDNAISNFYTDYAKKVKFNTQSEKSLKITYQLFPIKNIRVYIDGKKVSYKINEDLLEFVVPKGEHKVKIVYKHSLLALFNTMFFLYITCLLWIGISRLIKFIRENKKGIL
ncbi:hypothetical protein ACFL4A_00655 [bacterium]